MDKFTPGPWRVDDAKMQCNIVSANGEWIAELQEYAPPEQHRDRLWEDARLIAAAPELLEALRGIVDANWRDRNTACMKAREVIAKATLPQPRGQDMDILSAEAKGGKLWL